MHEILDVSRGPGGPFHLARCVGKGAVGRLGYGHPRMFGLFHQPNQGTGILRQEQAVGVERDHIGRIGDYATPGEHRGFFQMDPVPQ